jgi:hyperosmotically inducible periplasmic protein
MKYRLLWSLCGFGLLAAACAQSDPGITTSVKTQLASDDVVKARQIDVDTRDRVVTLTGEVRTQEEETKALQIARSASGVRDVVDQISVVPDQGAATDIGAGNLPAVPGVTLTNDAIITAAVKSKLLADPDTPGLKIDVDTSDQTVVLTGNVTTQAEKREVLAIARSVDGVKSVTDRITVDRQ